MTDTDDRKLSPIGAILDQALVKYRDEHSKDGNSFYMVLNDGRTFTGLRGCSLIRCPDAWSTESIEAAMAGDDGWAEIDEAEGREPVEDDDDDRDGLEVLIVFEG